MIRRRRRPLEEALEALLEPARAFNAAAVDALVELSRRLEEARTMPTTHAADAAAYALTPVLDPMSADHPGQRLTTAEAARVLPGYVGPVLTADGAIARGWHVKIDPQLPTGTIVVRPAAVTIVVREFDDLAFALLVAEHRRQAARFLRATVVRVALEAGLTDLRPFARPVGAA